MASKVAVVNLSGSLNAKNRDFARLSSPLGGQTPPRRPYRRIGGCQRPLFSLPFGYIVGASSRRIKMKTYMLGKIVLVLLCFGFPEQIQAERIIRRRGLGR